jgi:hypothetical protein
MPIISADITKESFKYIESLIDNEVILTRSDALRQIIIEHRDKNKVLGEKKK